MTSLWVRGVFLTIAMTFPSFVGCKCERHEAKKNLSQLGSLPYASHVAIPARHRGKRGVTIHDKRRVASGYTLYATNARAELIDMQGNVRRVWKHATMTKQWHHVEPYGDGSLLVLDEKTKHLALLDRDSRMLWQRPIWAHHDVASRDAHLLVLTRKIERISFEDKGAASVVSDYISELDADGALIRDLSLMTLFSAKIPKARITAIQEREASGPLPERLTDTVFDVLHSNSLEVLPRDVPGLGRAGQVLISLRELDLLAVIDWPSGRILWSWGPGTVQRQHQPLLLTNNRVLLFDNGTKRGWSRLVELDPQSNELAWAYQATPPSAFFSEWGGGVQRLENGNTLVADTVSGRIFEITPRGEVVWEYWNNDVWKGVSRGSIYRAQRISVQDARTWRWVAPEG